MKNFFNNIEHIANQVEHTKKQQKFKPAEIVISIILFAEIYTSAFKIAYLVGDKIKACIFSNCSAFMFKEDYLQNTQ